MEREERINRTIAERSKFQITIKKAEGKTQLKRNPTEDANLINIRIAREKTHGAITFHLDVSKGPWVLPAGDIT